MKKIKTDSKQFLLGMELLVELCKSFPTDFYLSSELDSWDTNEVNTFFIVLKTDLYTGKPTIKNTKVSSVYITNYLVL